MALESSSLRRVYPCNWPNCQQTFPKQYQASRHRKTHTRPYKCTLCKSRFALTADLKRHKLTHDKNDLDDLKFSCNYPGCSGKVYSRKDNLRKHMRQRHEVGVESGKGKNYKQVMDLYNSSVQVTTPLVEARLQSSPLSLLEAIGAEDWSLVTALVRSGVGMGVRNECDRTPLSLISGMNQPTLLKLLLNSHACQPELPDLQGETALSHATRMNDPASIEALLTKHVALIDLVNRDGQTSIHIAVVNGHIEALKVLLKYGHDRLVDEVYYGLKRQRGESVPALIFNPALSLDHNSQILAVLLEHGLDLNREIYYPSTSLAKHGAGSRHCITFLGQVASTGCPDLVELFIRLGAKDTPRTPELNSAAHEAAACGNVDTLSSVLDNNEGYDLDSLVADAVRAQSVPTMRLLVERGARLSGPFPVRGQEPRTSGSILHFVSRYGDSAAMELMVTCHSDTRKLDRGGRTALDVAINRGAIDHVRVLLDYEMKSFLGDVDGRGTQGVSSASAPFPSLIAPLPTSEYLGKALLRAAAAKSLTAMGLLFEKGADVNHGDANGVIPLHKVCDGRQTEGTVALAQVLLDRGAHINARTKKGTSPLHMASQSDQADLLQFLITLGADIDAADEQGWTPLSVAACWGGLGAVQALIDMGAQIDCTNKTGRTALHRACTLWVPSTAVVRLMLEKGAPLNAQDHEGVTPLHEACRYNSSADIQQLLLEKGAFINAQDHKGITPLHRACSRPFLDGDTLQLLLEKGALVNVQNHEGTTPLHRACEGGNGYMIRLLLDAGADLTPKGVFRVGWRDPDCIGTALQAAAMNRHKEIVKLLLERGAHDDRDEIPSLPILP